MGRRAKTGSLLLLAVGVAGAAAIHRATHGVWFWRPAAPAAWPARGDARADGWVSWNPIPIGAIKGIRGERPDDVWAWSEGGIAHWDGRTWTRVLGPSRDFEGTRGGIDWVGVSAGTVWVRTTLERPTVHLGCEVYGGTVREDWCRLDGKWKKGNDCWRRDHAGSTPPASPSASAFVDNAELTRLWRAGHGLTSLPPMRLERGYRVGGGELWAVDETGHGLAHFDGRAWTVATNPTTLGAASAIWLASEDEGWAIGLKSIYRWDGRDWSTATEARATLLSIWGSAADDVWAVGADGIAMHFDGHAWVDEQSLPGRPWLKSVTGRARDDVWVSGCDGTGFAAHWSGARWTARRIDPTGVLGAAERDSCALLASQPDGRALASVGASMFTFGGVDWRETPGPLWKRDGALVALGWIGGLAAGEGNDVWAVGGQNTGLYSIVYSPLVLQRRGEVWKKIDVGVGVSRGAASAVWPRAADDVWVVGTDGLVLHFDGRSWTREESGTDEDLVAIHGAGDTIWIIGAEGGLLRRRL